MAERSAALLVQLAVGISAGRDKNGREGIDKFGAPTATVLSNIVQKVDEDKFLLLGGIAEVFVPDVHNL